MEKKVEGVGQLWPRKMHRVEWEQRLKGDWEETVWAGGIGV